jgi:hypothetical protein
MEIFNVLEDRSEVRGAPAIGQMSSSQMTFSQKMVQGAVLVCVVTANPYWEEKLSTIDLLVLIF